MSDPYAAYIVPAGRDPYADVVMTDRTRLEEVERHRRQAEDAIRRAGGRPPPSPFVNAQSTAPARPPVRGHVSPTAPFAQAAVDLVAQFARSGSRLGRMAAGDPPARPSRSTNPLVDALLGAASGATGTVVNTMTAGLSPDAMFSEAQGTVNRILPVAAGEAQNVVNRVAPSLAPRVSAADQSAMVAGMEDARPGQSTSEMNQGLIAALTNDYQPSTSAGRVGQRVGAAAPYAATPGGVLPTIMGVLGGEGAQAAATAAGANEDQRNAANFAGNTLGGMISTPGVRARPAERILRDATQDLTPQDFSNMHRLMEADLALPGGGVRLGADEALSQVAQGRTTALQGRMRQLSRTPSGSRAISQHTAGRPERVRATTEAVADQIAPTPQDPAVLSVRARDAATGAIRTAESRRTAAVDPLYERADLQYPDPTGVMDIADALRARARQDRTGLIAPGAVEMADAIMGPQAPTPAGATASAGGGAATPAPAPAPYPTLNVENAARLRRYYRDTSEIPLGEPGALNRETAGVIGGASQRLQEVLLQNPDYAAAENLYAQISRDTVDPMMAGPVGQMTRTDAPGAASPMLYPSAPREAQPARTVHSLQALEGQDPGVGAQLTRSHLVDALNAGLTRNRGGASPTAGANVANRVAGNPEQRATFQAGVDTVAPQASPNVATLIDALQATGTRLGEGSPTATDTAAIRDTGAMDVPAEVAISAMRPVNLFQRINENLSNAYTNWNARDIMNMVHQDPATAEAILRNLPQATQRRQITALIKALGAAQATESVR